MPMSNLEVLCVTMHQKDFSKLKEMNIQSDVVFANQADRYAYEELEFNGHTARMITTDQRGVGKNRNTALLYARGNVCLFSDDDVCYADGYAEKVVAAFDEVPNADVIVFNLTSKSERTQKQNNRIKKCKKWNVLGFGTCRIAIKLDAVQRANIWSKYLSHFLITSDSRIISGRVPSMVISFSFFAMFKPPGNMYPASRDQSTHLPT
jgi:glycosyltransferase involved in cell wall biosynthesis